MLDESTDSTSTTATDAAGDSARTTHGDRQLRASGRPARRAEPAAKKTAKKAATKRTAKKAAAAVGGPAVTEPAPAETGAGSEQPSDAPADAPAKKAAKRGSRSAKKAAQPDSGSTPASPSDDQGGDRPAVTQQPPAAAPAGGMVLFQAPEPVAADPHPLPPGHVRCRTGDRRQRHCGLQRGDASGIGGPRAERGRGRRWPRRRAATGDDSGEPGEGQRKRRRRGGRGRRGRSEGDSATDERTREHRRAARPTPTPTAMPRAMSEPGRGRRGRRVELQPPPPPSPPLRARATPHRVRTTRRTPSSGSASAVPRGDEITGVRGSTRLEAKKQRRREGREQGRRKQVITEAEFLARRESVERVMVVRQTGGRTQIGVLEDDVLVEHYVSRDASASMAGNVYLGRVQNVLPSMEAAFVDIGKGRNAVLYAGEVNWDAAGVVGPGQADRERPEVRRVRAGAGDQGPDRAQGRPADQPDLAARPLPGLRPRRAR